MFTWIWIPVAAMKPDSTRHVLVSVLCDADNPPTRTAQIAVWLDGRWEDQTGDEEIEFEGYTVTHWLELPSDPG